jgi:hypothetical protein
VTDRLGLISDSFAAGKAGYSSIVDSLALVEHFGEHETAGEWLTFSLGDNMQQKPIANALLSFVNYRLCCLARVV